MKRLIGNQDHAHVFQASASRFQSKGDGITPGQPIATYGGVITYVMDVTIPATLASTDADWSALYPTYGLTTSFPVLEYHSPIDTSKKLHGVGNLAIVGVQCHQGALRTGAVAPTGGSVVVARIEVNGVDVWSAGAFPGGAASNIGSFSGIVRCLGADETFVQANLKVTAGATPIVSGRLRFVISAIEF